MGEAGRSFLAAQLQSSGDAGEWALRFLPETPAAVLDVGTGLSRSASFATPSPHRLVAVGSPDARDAGTLLGGSNVRWVNDALPGFEQVHRLGASFDLVAIGDAWWTLPTSDRPRAFRKLITLLKAGGAIAIRPSQDAHEASFEVEGLARNHGAFVEHRSPHCITVRLPDDGTGALPTLRHIILNDDKSSTYKLALLRVLCRIADGAPGYGRLAEDGSVGVPLGLVGLYWIRSFLPLLESKLPQARTNSGFDGLGFVREAFRSLIGMSPMDLRVGVEFSETRSAALHQALRDACATICRMPAHYITYPNGKQMLPVVRQRPFRAPKSVRLDDAYLSSFGEMRVPEHLWRAMQRFDVWIEPALVAEWSRLTREYAFRQGKIVDEATVAKAMLWSDPIRDVQFAKQRAVELIERGKIYCVWSGKSLSRNTLDIDHCFPWSAWPCGDLWNLMPTDRRVNQHQKRHRLPSIELMRSAQDRIVSWWREGYHQQGNAGLMKRFALEARASLSIGGESDLDMDELFSAVELRQVRLQLDQQVQVWKP